MSIQLSGRDARKRPRYTLPGRAFMAVGIGVIEGGVALLFGLGLLLMSPPLQALFVAIPTVLAYGFFSVQSARRFLAYADLRQPFALHAVLSWLFIAGLCVLVDAAISGLAPAYPGILLWLLAGAAILTGLRIAIYRLLSRMLARGQLQVERFGIIGDAASIERLRSDPRIWKMGGQVVTSLTLPEGLGGMLPSGETIAEFARSCVEKKCQHVLLVADLDEVDSIAPIVSPCRPFALNILLYPRSSMDTSLVDIVPLGSGASLRLLSAPLGGAGRLLKRSFDIAGASVGLLLLSPLLLIIALVVRLTSPGPALYFQERRGFNGSNFRILKFRSMTVMEDGRSMQQAQLNDPRVTPVGRFLRRTSLDELPQLINVLRGEMSLVGPRPHAISHDDELSGKFDLYAQRQRIKPGITGWAQVNGYRGDTSTQDKIEGRTLHDLYYAENWSLLLDVWIVILTIFSPRTRQNAR